MKKRGVFNISECGRTRGQVTIFIIVAVLMVASIGIFFLLRSDIIGDIGIGGKRDVSFSSFLDTCLEDKVKEVSEELSLHGGYLDAELSVNFLFTEEGVARDITYLCYTQNNFKPCVNQKPTFVSDLESNIKNQISEEIQTCFDEMKDSFRNQGFEISSNPVLKDFEVNLKPKRIVIETDSEITLTKSGESSTQENFEISINSRLFEITQTVQEIVNQEAQFCYFEVTGFLLTYPDFVIDLFRMDDFTEIYTVEHKNSKEKFRFAVRGCASPSF